MENGFSPQAATISFPKPHRESPSPALCSPTCEKAADLVRMNAGNYGVSTRCGWPAALRGGPVCRYRARVGLCLPSLPAGTALSRRHVPATNRLPPLPASTAFTPHRAFCAPGPAAPRRARRLQCGGQSVIIEQSVWMTRKYRGFEGEIDRPWGSGLLGKCACADGVCLCCRVSAA